MRRRSATRLVRIGVSAYVVPHNLLQLAKYFALSAAMVSLPVGIANFLLDTEYTVYTDGDRKISRVESYSLPQHLHEHIDTIQPTTYFSTMRPHVAHNTPFAEGEVDFDALAFQAAKPGANVQSLYTRPKDSSIPFSCNATVTVECIRHVIFLVYHS